MAMAGYGLWVALCLCTVIVAGGFSWTHCQVQDRKLKLLLLTWTPAGPNFDQFWSMFQLHSITSFTLAHGNLLLERPGTFTLQLTIWAAQQVRKAFPIPWHGASSTRRKPRVRMLEKSWHRSLRPGIVENRKLVVLRIRPSTLGKISTQHMTYPHL